MRSHVTVRNSVSTLVTVTMSCWHRKAPPLLKESLDSSRTSRASVEFRCPPCRPRPRTHCLGWSVLFWLLCFLSPSVCRKLCSAPHAFVTVVAVSGLRCIVLSSTPNLFKVLIIIVNRSAVDRSSDWHMFSTSGTNEIREVPFFQEFFNEDFPLSVCWWHLLRERNSFIALHYVYVI